MPVQAITADYQGQVRDRVENFHGNILVFINWLDHLLFLCPTVIMIPADTTFQTLLSEHLPTCFARHPDWEQVDPAKLVWELDGAPFTPESAKTLAQQGIGHKSLLQFQSPGLKGVAGSSY